MIVVYIFFFFFSSRRRHTRWPRDWSSDVCSSDLVVAGVTGLPKFGLFRAPHEPFAATTARLQSSRGSSCPAGSEFQVRLAAGVVKTVDSGLTARAIV